MKSDVSQDCNDQLDHDEGNIPCVSMYLSICVYVYVHTCLSVCLSVCLCTHMHTNMIALWIADITP